MLTRQLFPQFLVSPQHVRQQGLKHSGRQHHIGFAFRTSHTSHLTFVHVRVHLRWDVRGITQSERHTTADAHIALHGRARARCGETLMPSTVQHPIGFKPAHRPVCLWCHITKQPGQLLWDVPEPCELARDKLLHDPPQWDLGCHQGEVRFEPPSPSLKELFGPIVD